MADKNQMIQPLTATADVDPSMHFKVTKIHAIATWSWDFDVESCAICRNHIMSPCIECQANLSTQEDQKCSIAWGQCNHAYHMHCISRWLKTRPVCPLDNQEWSLARYSD